MDFKQFEILSFDCYGTLIDWRSSVLEIIMPILNDYNIEMTDEEIFGLFLDADRKTISREYIAYREVLTRIMENIGKILNLNLQQRDKTCLVDRFGDWHPFPDSHNALVKLQEQYKLAIISNVDDEMFNLTMRCIGIRFEYIVTAKQVQSYKPSHNNFNVALEKFGVPKEKVLHVAQSIHHDIRPTNELGWHNVWVNRYNEPERTDPAEFPDLEVPDLASLVRIINLNPE
jgi:2-haloacid dehalogenase